MTKKPGANTSRKAVEAIEKNFDLRFSCYHLKEGYIVTGKLEGRKLSLVQGIEEYVHSVEVSKLYKLTYLNYSKD